jgi:hypothetical protein
METTNSGIMISFVTYYGDGTESRATSVAPMDEAVCKSMVGTYLSRLFKAPVDEHSTPGGLVSAPPPVTKVECRLEVFQDPTTVLRTGNLPNTQFPLGYD